MNMHLPRARRYTLFALLAIIGLGVGFAPRCGHTQSYPSKPIRLVLPYPAGGGIDLVARPLAERLTEIFGQTVIVDNRGGASGLLAMQQVAAAPADGYTLVLALNTQIAVNPGLFSKLPYDPVKDFAPVVLIGSAPYLLATNTKVPLKTLADIIALAKTEPGKLSYASSGNGSGAHLSMEMLKSMAHIDVIHIPYKTTATSVHDVIAGDVQMLFVTIGTVREFIKASMLIPIAVSGAKRVASLPDVPTMAESGLPGFESVVWYGILAPADTPKDIISFLNKSMNAVIQEPAFQARLANESVEISGGTPEQFKQYIASELVKWKQVIMESGAKLD